MPAEQIITYLSGITTLSMPFINEVNEQLKRELYKSHQIIQAQDQPETRLWFLKKGFARSYFYDENGNEHTTRFWHEDQIIFSFSGIYNLPAMEYIEILGEAELNSLTYAQVNELRLYPETNAILKFVIKNALQQKYRRHVLCTLPAAKRYQRFRKEHPEVFRSAPLRIIASYLNMTRESLSRIISQDHSQ
jgi:CRP-like cAMP-binding protein